MMMISYTTTFCILTFLIQLSESFMIQQPTTTTTTISSSVAGGCNLQHERFVSKTILFGMFNDNDDTIMNTKQTTNNQQQQQPCHRRMVLNRFISSGSLFALIATGSSMNANSLDMDAFINSQLDADTKNCDPKRDPKCIPKLNADEALCKYGQSGDARGEACRRVKEAGGTLNKPGSATTKSLGGAYAM